MPQIKKPALPLVSLLCLLVTVENIQFVYPLEGVTQIPTAFQKLNNNDTALILPLTNELKEDGTVKHWSDVAKKNVNYMNWSVDSQAKLLNGYSGIRPWTMQRLPRFMESFPSASSIKMLEEFVNLNQIILMPDFGNIENITEKITPFASSLKNLEYFGDSYKIDFAPLTKLGDPKDFALRTPSSHQGQLYLDFKTESFSNNPVLVKVYIDKYFQQTSYAEISVVADTNWNTVTLPTPKTSEKLVPYLFRFEPQKTNTVYLGSRKFVSEVR